jgi:hypothetical protein
MYQFKVWRPFAEVSTQYDKKYSVKELISDFRKFRKKKKHVPYIERPTEMHREKKMTIAPVPSPPFFAYSK